MKRIGYLVNAYPVVSETFLVHELRALEAKGLELVILALSRRRDTLEHSATSGIQAVCHRPPTWLPWGWLALVTAHIEALSRAPLPYLRILRDDVAKPSLVVLRSRLRSGKGNARRRLRIFRLAPLVARKARRESVVHLHAHYAKDPLELAARVGWLTGIPYSFAAHAKDLYTTPPERLRRRLKRARFALTCHRHGFETLRRIAREHDRSKVILLPHGLDTDLFQPGSAERDENLILAVGRLTPKKGFDTLIQACTLLRGDRPFRCVIFGAGRLGRALRIAIRGAGLQDTVELRGYVAQEELASWYRRATLLVLPARVLETGNRDGIPNVLLEAMACATPIVTTPVGGIPEIIQHDVNGLLVEPDQPSDLAASLGKLLAEPGVRRRLGTAAAGSVAGRGYRRMAAPLAKRFQRICQRAGGKPQEPLRSHIPDFARMSAHAARKLGLQPRYLPEVEAAIFRAITPGLKANAWRPDLSRLVERRVWDEVFKARRATELLRYAADQGLALNGDTRVLDLGCGRGGLAVALRAQGIRAVGLDLRHRNCAVTRLRGQRYGLDVPTSVGSAGSLPFPPATFHIVCLLEVLEHVADPRALLAEVRRVFRPGGTCVVTVVNRWAHFDPHYNLWGVNFMPRSWARAYIALRGRQKLSLSDHQTLEDMHYFSYSAFREIAESLDFEVLDPQAPRQPVPAALHRLRRTLSLGFNTATLVLVPR